MSGFAEWLQHSALSQLLEPGASWIIPLFQMIHILSIAVVISSMIMVNGRLIHASMVNQSVPEIMHRFLPWMWIGLAVLLLTGSTLIVMEPGRTLGKTIFWMKMSAIVLGVLMTASLQRDVMRRPEHWTGEVLRPAVAWVAGINMLLWVFIIFAGRWIAYT